MSIRIGDWVFDNVEYDAEADVLYMSMGEPRSARSEETPEGHVLRYDADTGEFIGLTLIGVVRIFNENGDVGVSIPRREHVPVEELDLAMA